MNESQPFHLLGFDWYVREKMASKCLNKREEREREEKRREETSLHFHSIQQLSTIDTFPSFLFTILSQYFRFIVFLLIQLF